MTGAKTFTIIVGVIIVIVLLLSIVRFFLTRDGSEEAQVEGPVVIPTLYNSTDGGATWQGFGEFRGGLVTTLDFDSASQNNLLVGTFARGVWRGTVAGTEWQQYPGGVGETARIFDLIEPARGDEFLALVLFTNRGRIIRYRDGNRTELFFTPLERFAFLKGYKTVAGFLRVIGSDGGFYESRNSGQTWRPVSRFQSGLLAMTFDPRRDNEIWVVDPGGNFYRSVNGGNFWTDLTEGLREFGGYQQLGFIFFDEVSGMLFHGSKHGLLRSFDRGVSWEFVNMPVAPESLPATSMAVDPRNSMKMYVAAQNQVYISEDGGVSWRGIRVAETGVISNMLINPRNTKEIFIGFSRI